MVMGELIKTVTRDSINLLWPNWIGALALVIFPFLALLNEISTSDLLEAERIAVFFGVLQSSVEEGGLSDEVGLVRSTRSQVSTSQSSFLCLVELWVTQRRRVYVYGREV